MPGPYLVTLPESEVSDLTSTTTDSEIFFDTEEYFTPGNDAGIKMEDVSGVGAATPSESVRGE
ncbi:unnamed protein product [Penicillium palitans]